MQPHRILTTRSLFTAFAIAALTLVMAACTTIDRSHGMRYYETGDFDRAGTTLTAVTDRDPTDWQALYYLGLVRLKQGRALDAQLVLEQAYQLRHDFNNTGQSGDILDALAEALYQQKRTANLYAVLDEATNYYGTSRDYIRQGKYLGLSGDADGARLAFTKAARSAKTGDPDPYVAMADFYESIGDMPNAVTNLRKAYYVAPTNTQLAARLEQHGIIPGPTAGIQPDAQ